MNKFPVTTKLIIFMVSLVPLMGAFNLIEYYTEVHTWTAVAIWAGVAAASTLSNLIQLKLKEMCNVQNK